MFKKLLTVIAAVAALASCQKATEYYMTLSEKEFSVSDEGETITFDLNTNTYVRINNDMDWGTLSQTAQNGTTSSYSLVLNANEATEARVGTIRFIGDYVTPLKLTVTQKAKVPTGVSPAEISVERAATSTTFTVLGDKQWSATSNNPAFTLNPESGLGETEVTVSFPANETYDPVTARITVTIGNESYNVTITQAAAPKKEYNDLSASETSNCYLVKEPGYYKFKADVRGNGVVPASQTLSAAISPASVKVLWSTVNTDTAPASDDVLIQNVTLEEGYVKFNTNLDKFVEGNAVIAAYDAANAIVWSWHIWITDANSDVTVGTVIWMDRNLGALAPSTNQTVDPLSAGFFYQWGRKDPFRGTYTYQEPDVADPDMATTGTWPDPELIVEGKGGVESSIANPQLYWYVSGSSYNNKDWHWGVQYDDLWGAGAVAKSDFTAFPKSTKTMFDPCPAGYCVPTSQQFSETATAAGLSKTTIYNNGATPAICGNGNDTFYLTYPGGRAYDSGKITGPVGQYSWYATSCTNGINEYCTRSHTTACNFGAAASGRTAGYTVRCVKE